MNDVSILKSDVFFFVATVSVTFITIVILTILFYVVSIVRTIRAFVKTAKTGADVVVEGLHEAKTAMNKEGFASSTVINIFKKLYQKRKK